MFNDRSSLLSYLATRRSGRPRDLVSPGPDPSQLRTIIELGSRTPDHGKLHPWRFIHIPREKRQAFSDLLRNAYLEERPSPGRLEVEANEKFAMQAPELLVALFSPRPVSKIPLWEQQLSCGAVCFNILNAAGALGFEAGWVTGWAAYSDAVLRAFGSTEERIAGFIFIGTAAAPLEERPRPALGEIYSEWSGA
jgi:nitroreductase